MAYKLTIHEIEKPLQNTSLLNLEKVEISVNIHLVSILTVNGKSKFLDKNITEEQFKELTGNVNWGEAANMLSAMIGGGDEDFDNENEKIVKGIDRFLKSNNMKRKIK